MVVTCCSWLIAFTFVLYYTIDLQVSSSLIGAARYVPGSQTAPGLSSVSVTFQSGQGADPFTGTGTVCLNVCIFAIQISFQQ